MNDKFDELARNMAQSVTRRGALKKFGVGLAGVVLAALGLANNAHAGKNYRCNCKLADYGCAKRYPTDFDSCYYYCNNWCEGPVG